MKAMILAAGRGERLRPITDTLPKPLVKVRGKPLIAWHLERLSAAGFREIVINVSHLGDLVEGAVGDGHGWGLRVAWSRETAPLETAGGIAQALGLLGPAPFLLVNADVFCAVSFSALRRIKLDTRLGHLVMVPNPTFRPEGDFSLSEGRIGSGATPRYTYAGISVLSPSIVGNVVPGSKAPLGPLLRRAADGGFLGGELYSGGWSDVGTPERLAELNRVKAS